METCLPGHYEWRLGAEADGRRRLGELVELTRCRIPGGAKIKIIATAMGHGPLGLWSKQMGRRSLNEPTPLRAPVWFVAAFTPMVASQVLRLRQHDPGGWLFWDYAGRLGGLAVLAALAWPIAFRGEKLRMPWMQVLLWVLGIVLINHYLGGWIRATGNHLFPSTVLGHYPLSKGWLHWFDIAFGLGLDTYTEEVVFRRCARQVFEPLRW